MTRTMRAMELPAVAAPLRPVRRDVPRPGAGEALVRIQACGVCGSDLFLQKGGFGADKLPRIPGHEAAGVVESVGPDVTHLAPGDQVALYYIDNVADAPRPNLGPHVVRMGVDVDGAFAEYVARPARTLIKVADPVDPVTLAVLTDAVATPYHALTVIGRLRAGESVAVLGVGGIGSNAVQLAKIMGASVVAVGRSPHKLELARDLGADRAGSLDDARAAHPEGYDLVVQCGASAALDRAAVELAGYAGRVVLVGTTPEAFSVRASELVWRELQVLGSRGFTIVDIEAVIDWYLAGRIRTAHLTDNVLPLEEANQAFAALVAGRVLRSVLVP